MKQDQKIGVLGGMGPMATSLFYKMVIERTEASCDQDHVNMIIVSDASMPDRTGAILSGQYGEVLKKLREDAEMLEKAGCQALAITCNTAHYFADMISETLTIPIIHMIRETAARLAEETPGGKIALLATDGTVKTGIYQKPLEEAGLSVYIPKPHLQKIVMHQIYDRIKAGKDWDKEQWEELEQAIRAEGCQRAVMGCTELSVIKADYSLDDFYLDPMEVLAEKVIAFSGKKLKQGKR